MHLQYDTPRLHVKTLNETYASQVLQFYSKGSEVFDKVEPPKAEGYYTNNYQTAQLRGEMNAFMTGSYARYFFMEQFNPNVIIGTVSISNIQRGAYNSCVIGYKLLPEFQKRGYALEGISRIIQAVFEENHMHRIEAFVLPDNNPSIRLLTRLGFQFEGIAHSIINLGSGYVDHCRYVLINPSDC